MPKTSAPKLHQRNGARSKTFLMLPAKRLRQRAVRCGAPPCGPQNQEALRSSQWPEGFEPISLEPAPSHRPWASAAGATPPRTGVAHGRCRARTRTATQAAAPDAAAPVSTSPPTRSLPWEDLGIPRRLVEHRCGANSTAAILDVPAWGATPRGSVSDYDKEEKPSALGYFLT